MDTFKMVIFLSRFYKQKTIFWIHLPFLFPKYSLGSYYYYYSFVISLYCHLTWLICIHGPRLSSLGLVLCLMCLDPITNTVSQAQDWCGLDQLKTDKEEFLSVTIKEWGLAGTPKRKTKGQGEVEKDVCGRVFWFICNKI